MDQRFFSYFDTEFRLHESEADAIAEGESHLRGCKEAWDDGWPDDTGTIVVGRITHRAQENDPNLDYRAVQFVLKPVEDERQSKLEAVVRRLASFDQKFPKGRIYSAHDCPPERELDSIIADAKAAIGVQ